MLTCIAIFHRAAPRLTGLMVGLALSGCGVTGWQDPPRGLQTVCDDAGSRTNIGPDTRLDARPRPECRPGTPTVAR